MLQCGWAPVRGGIDFAGGEWERSSARFILARLLSWMAIFALPRLRTAPACFLRSLMVVSELNTAGFQGLVSSDEAAQREYTPSAPRWVSNGAHWEPIKYRN